jgi:glycosyltransferase involved in cell wall biosynthesis
MATATPKVSVCIPVFNGANYIAASIDSVLGQTFEDFELIVCDNCSTDGTADIVRSYRDPRVSYTRNAMNLGVAGNFNRCLELARCEYVCIWHHDDIMLPENLELKVRVLDQRPSVGFVHSNILLIDGEGRPLERQWNADSSRDYIEPGLSVFRRYVAHMLTGVGMIFMGAVVTRRVCYERLGGFLTELPNCHDNEMWMRIALYYDVACLATPLVKWRQHAASTSNASVGLQGAHSLQQHYDAIRMVCRNHSHRIPDHAALYRQTTGRFGRKALEEGWEAFHRRRFALSRAYVWKAARIHPRVVACRGFWSLAARLAAGAQGGRLYRALREAVRRARDKGRRFSRHYH